MYLWRISNYGDLGGVGGTLTPGRWNTLGRPVTYLSEHPALALVEILVHLELTPDILPDSYKLLKAETSDKIGIRSIDLKDLVADWRLQEGFTRGIGDAWLSGGETALLRVPSAVVPESSNYLLNPRHAEANGVSILWYEEYPFDKRLFGTKK